MDTNLLRREESEPSQTGQDVVSLLIALEGGLGSDGLNESFLIR